MSSSVTGLYQRSRRRVSRLGDTTRPASRSFAKPSAQTVRISELCNVMYMTTKSSKSLLIANKYTQVIKRQITAEVNELKPNTIPDADVQTTQKGHTYTFQLKHNEFYDFCIFLVAIKPTSQFYGSMALQPAYSTKHRAKYRLYLRLFSD